MLTDKYAAIGHLIKHFHIPPLHDDMAKLFSPANYSILSQYIKHKNKTTTQWNKVNATEKKHFKNSPDILTGF